MASLVETSGPLTASGAPDYTANTGTTNIQALEVSKGVAKVTLKKNGSPLASAQVALKDVTAGSSPFIQLVSGTEGDNGSTATFLKWFYNTADIAQYEVYFEFSGKMAITGIPGGAYASVFGATGNGHCTISMPVAEGI